MMLIVMTTVPDAIFGEDLARRIVEARLAACVQILPAMRSVYFWENAVQTDEENLLLIKTAACKYDELEEFIRSNHKYDVPEIVAITADEVSDDYLAWLKKYLD